MSLLGKNLIHLPSLSWVSLICSGVLFINCCVVMDKMFARFEGRKSLKKTKNVDVHDDKVECGHYRDNI